MVRLSRRLLPIALLFLLVACGGPAAPTSPSGPQVKKDVHVLGKDARSALTAFSLDKSTGAGVLHFNASDPAVKALAVGQVLVSRPVGTVAPHGLLQRVTSKTTHNGQVVVKTSQATLTDVFKQADINYQQALKPANVVSAHSKYKGVTFAVNHPNAPIRPSGLGFDFHPTFHQVLIDLDGNPATTNDQLTLNGSLDFNASAQASISIHCCIHVHHFRFVANLDENANVQVTGNLSQTIQKSVEVASYNFGDFTVMVGYVPVVFTIDLVLEVGASGHISAHIETSASQSTSVEVGADYTHSGGWSPIDNVNSTFSYTAPTFNAGTSAKGFVEPSLGIYVYGLAGPYIDAQAYIQADVELHHTPYWDLKGGLDFGIGFAIQLPVVGRVAAWSTDVNALERTIATSANANPTLTIDQPADGSTAQDGATADFAVHANDRESDNVSVALSEGSNQVGTGTSVDGSTVHLTTQALCVGPHTFTVTATDGAGNSVSKAISLNVLDRVPQVSIQAQQPPIYAGGYLSAHATVSDITCHDLSGTHNVDPSLVVWTLGGTRIGSTANLVAAVPSSYGPGDTATLKASYDDGTKVGTAQTGITFTSPPPGTNVPPQVTIYRPVSQTPPHIYYLQSCSDTMTLNGTGTDYEDGHLTGTSLAWTFDGSALATGASPTVNFCDAAGVSSLNGVLGTHTVTLTATDSGGATTSTSVTFVLDTLQ